MASGKNLYQLIFAPNYYEDSMLTSILHIVFTIAFLYAACSVIYLFVLALWGRLFFKHASATSEIAEPKNRIAILVPAYKEDGIITATATHLLRQNYPANLYDVYIIADSFQPKTIEQLKKLQVHVLEVSFEKSTKSKALNQAFHTIIKPYDIALICDADNILAKDFLNKINTAFVAGAQAVQGRRVAKNLDSAFAVLDACSEGINNNIFRKGANAIGLSSSVIGSGMAFEYANLKQVMAGIEAVGGFDKIMQLKIVEQGISIRYLEDAIVFDEKVESSQAFQQQRKRWVSSQFIYLKKFFVPACKQLLRGNFSYFNLAVANNLVLPRAFLLIILPLLIVAGFLLHTAWGFASVFVLFLYLLCLFIALPTELINKDLWAALNKLPGAIMVMAGTLFGMKKANKTFIHTVHTKTKINNPSFNEHSH